MKAKVLLFVFALLILGGAVYWLAPTTTCADECGASDSELADPNPASVSKLYADAVKEGNKEKQIYYAMIGALAGEEGLKREYVNLFKGMDGPRRRSAVAVLESKPSSPARDALLAQLKIEAGDVTAIDNLAQ